VIRHPVALSAGSIVLAALVWVLSPYPLEWVGLGAFDPLGRICMLVLVLSIAEMLLARVGARCTNRHKN
jgi:hypothetical protein